MRNAVRNAAPAATTCNPLPLTRALVGAVIGSMATKSLPGREDLGIGKAREKLDGYAAARRREAERRPLVKDGIAIVEDGIAQRPLKTRKSRLFAGRNSSPIGHKPPHRGQFQDPLGARQVGKSEIRVKTKAHGHGAGGVGQKRRL